MEATAAALKVTGAEPSLWLVTGGGRKNGALMAGLEKRLGVPVRSVEAIGYDGDQLEAQLFGYLAIRSKRGLPLSFPTTTGVAEPLTGGVYWAKGWGSEFANKGGVAACEVARQKALRVKTPHS